MQLYSYQKDILDKDPLKTGIFLATGLGKTVIALLLAEGNTLCVVPKTLREDKTWQRNLEQIDNHKITKLRVISKEDFKKLAPSLRKFDTVILDEAHQLAGITPSTRYRKKVQIPRASQIFEGLCYYLKEYPPKRLYLVTATPIRSPMAVLGLAWLLGVHWDYYKFRERFYFRIPIPHREIWTPKKDKQTMEKLAELVNKLGITGRMEDYVDVPEQTFVIKNVGLTKDQARKLKVIHQEFPDPIVLIGKKHQIENGVLTGDEYNEPQIFNDNKIEAIEEMLLQYPKLLIFAKYKMQIQKIAKHFEKDIKVFTLTGDTKDRGQLMKDAEASERCIVIAQSGISAGYELPSFRCTIFASMDYSVVSYIQALGRTLRVNHLQKNLYVTLLAGEIDNAVNKAIQLKQDFNEKIYYEKGSKLWDPV